jgi:two-component system alkaline phosphatase synthesis response regulator PhoP
MASILVISNDRSRRNSIRHTLEHSGHRVVEADSGAVGICLLQREPAEVVLTEALQPRNSGLDTLLEVRKAAPAVRIIVLSGWRFGGRREARAVAKALGAQCLVEPPCATRTLLRAVREVLTPAGPAV